MKVNLLEIYKELVKSNKLNEANLKKLSMKTQNETPKVHGRAMNMLGDVRYFGLSKDGTLNFKVKSQTRAGKYHFCYIEVGDIIKFGEVFDDGGGFDLTDFTRLLGMNGFRVHCNDESFLYWAWQYLATINNYEIEPETRAPKRNNVLLAGSLCKHLQAVIYNLFNNQIMKKAITKDINNYLRMLMGFEYDDYQQQNYARQVQQQNRAVKWKNKPSDYMNDYFARSAKNHSFLDDRDIKKSLKKEMNKYLKAKPNSTVDDFLRSYFQMTQKAFAEDMKIPEDAIEDYFDELGFTNKKEALNQEPEVTSSTTSDTVDNTEDSKASSVLGNSILQKDSEISKKKILLHENNSNLTIKAQSKTQTNVSSINTNEKNNESYNAFKRLTENDSDGALKYSITLYKEYLDLHIKTTEEVFDNLVNLAEVWKETNTLDENQDHPFTWILDNVSTLTSQIKKHDASKFLGEEFEEYRKHFYPITAEEKLNSEGFKNACTLHVSNNMHHWEYWCTLDDKGKHHLKEDINTHTYRLALIERVCDEACMSMFFENRLTDWYKENSYKMCELEEGKTFYKDLIDIVDKNNLDIDESVTKAYQRIQEKKKKKLLQESIVEELKKDIDRSNLWVHTNNKYKSVSPVLGRGFYLFNVNSISHEKYIPISKAGDTQYYRLNNNENLVVLENQNSVIPFSEEQLKKLSEYFPDINDIKNKGASYVLNNLSKLVGNYVGEIFPKIGIDGFLILEMINSYDENIKEELLVYNMNILKEVTSEVI